MSVKAVTGQQMSEARWLHHSQVSGMVHGWKLLKNYKLESQTLNQRDSFPIDSVLKIFYSDSSSLNPILQNLFIQQRSTEHLICNEHS